MIILLIALLPASWLILTNRDVPQFGRYQDGELLFINAKSLSEGHGFRISSLPGQPYQTKYQPLQPLLLAAIWKFDPNFPANLRFIALYDWIMFVVFVLASALFLATIFSPIEAAALAASIALSPLVIYWATVPTADYLCAALIMTTFVAARRAFFGNARWFVVAGMLAAGAYLTKSAGIFVVPAVLVAACLRRNWRGALLFLAPATPAILGWIAWAQAHRAAGDHPVLWYYTDYIGAHVKNGGLAAIPQILSVNIMAFAGAAGSFVIHDLPDSMVGRFFCILIATALITGAVRIGRLSGDLAYPLFCGMLAAALCVWNFSPNVRLILPIIPLVAAGAYLELKQFYRLTRDALKARGSNRLAAYLLTAAFLIGCGYAIRQNGLFIFRNIPALIEQAREENRRAGAAYQWMRAWLPSSSVVLASEDTLVYLNAGLASVSPVPDSVAFYRRDHARMLDNFTNFKKLGSFFGVTHILLAPGDFATLFDAEDQAEIRRLLLDVPHREVYNRDGYQILQLRLQ